MIEAKEGIFETKIISPLVYTEQLKAGSVETQEVQTQKLATGIISPLADGGEVEIQSAKFKVQSYSSKFKVVDPEDKEVASVDAFGHLKAQVAEIAERIKTKTLEVEELFIDGKEITRMERINTDDTDSESGNPLDPSTSVESVSDDLLTIPDNPDEEQPPLVLASDWTVLGTTSLAQTSVAGIFSQDGSLVIDKGSEIDNIVGTLYLQRLGRGGLDILNGKVAIDTEGNLTVSGNIVATGDVEVGGTVRTNIISPLAKGNLVIRLGGAEGRRSSEALAKGEKEPAEDKSPTLGSSESDSGEPPSAEASEGGSSAGSGELAPVNSRLAIHDAEDKEVASIDSKGVARFAKLAFAEEGTRIERMNTDKTDGENDPLNPSTSVESVSNSSVGTAILPSGDHSVEIETTAVTEDSLIFVTPTSPTGGSTLYVSEKQAGESFTVSLEKEYEERDVKFNWWVIN